VQMRMRLYRLGELVQPDPLPPGGPRVADAGDRELLVAWTTAFAAEAGVAAHDVETAVDRQLGHGGLALWETGSAPVCMVGTSRRVAGTSRIGPVYTPPPLRGRRYASALTAAASRAALDGGASEVLLFTDLANPTSNALYQRLGYRPVEDRITLTFAP
jgi:predicted GNAT family acetyltransferase